MKAIWAWMRKHPQRTVSAIGAGIGYTMAALPTLSLGPRALALALAVLGTVNAMLATFYKPPAEPELPDNENGVT